MKCTIMTKVEVDGSKAMMRLNTADSAPVAPVSSMAVNSDSLVGKCLYNNASETPAALANSRVVVPWKPFSAKTFVAASTMALRRSSAVSREELLISGELAFTYLAVKRIRNFSWDEFNSEPVQFECKT